MIACKRYYRKVIRIKAEDSPNVQLALRQKAEGKEPTGRVLIPGVLTYDDYLKRRATWDTVRQCIGLDGEFYQGKEALLFPPTWLNRLEDLGRMRNPTNRKALGIGVDSAQGGDNTCWVAVDRLGLIELISKKTPDTSVITGETIAFMTRWACDPERVLFDMGGGGKEHVDRLRSQGYRVRALAFGASATLERKLGRRLFSVRKEEDETRYTYKNKRAELYGTLRRVFDPDNGLPFGIPEQIFNQKRRDGGPSLREQLAPLPLTYDEEGRMYLLPKTAKDDTKDSLTKLLGCSPDEADALALAVYSMEDSAIAKTKLGPAF